MEKKERYKKGKKLIIDLNKKFQPKTPAVSTEQKWQPFGPFPSVLPPPLSPPFTSSVPAKNLVFGDLQPFKGAPPTIASDGAPATIDCNCPPLGFGAGIPLDRQPLNYGDVSALKTLPLLPTPSRKICEMPTDHQLAPSTMTIFYSGGVSAFPDISPEKAELVLGMASKSNVNEVIGSGSEEIERKRWKKKNSSHENPSCVTDETLTTATPSSSSGSFYHSFAPGAIAMARKATLARFLQKRKHRLIHSKTYLVVGEVPDLSL